MTIALFLILMALPFLVLLYFIIRNEHTYKLHRKVANAIHGYNMDAIERHRFDTRIDYDVIESYTKTFWRIDAWKCKHIVPPEIYIIIEPYLEENQ